MKVATDKSLTRNTSAHRNTEHKQADAKSPNDQRPRIYSSPLYCQAELSLCHMLPTSAAGNSQETDRMQVHQAQANCMEEPANELEQVKEIMQASAERFDKKQSGAKRVTTDDMSRSNHYHLAKQQQQHHLNQSKTTTTYHPCEKGYHSEHHQRLCLHDHLHGARFQSLPSRNLTHTSPKSQHKPQPRCHHTITANLPGRILALFLLNAILNHLAHIVPLGSITDGSHQLQLLPLPGLVMADIVNECITASDCGQLDKICYENKCICERNKPIEDKDRSMCLAHASLNEACDLSEQCIGSTVCTDGRCQCPVDTISIFNPSTQLHYCHPKRGLREECNYDSQCPENSFCSTKKHGCLCQNGYGAGLVRDSNGVEQQKCLPKACRISTECESEYHTCDENKCKCLATHFDPHTAVCHKFALTGGQLNGNTTILKNEDSNEGLTSIVNDLMRNGDKLWLVVIILAVLMLTFLALLIIVLRKYYLGYCWTRTKEYEPNNEQSPKNGQFSKNSINNKSFRKKSAELEDGDDDTAADRSNLVTAAAKKNGTLLSDPTFVKQNGGAAKTRHMANENHYVQVDMRGTSNEETSDDTPLARHSPRSHHRIITRPLPSSTSTPV